MYMYNDVHVARFVPFSGHAVHSVVILNSWNHNRGLISSTKNWSGVVHNTYTCTVCKVYLGYYTFIKTGWTNCLSWFGCTCTLERVLQLCRYRYIYQWQKICSCRCWFWTFTCIVKYRCDARYNVPLFIIKIMKFHLTRILLGMKKRNGLQSLVCTLWTWWNHNTLQ